MRIGAPCVLGIGMWVSTFVFGRSRFRRVFCVSIVCSFVCWAVLFIELFPGWFCEGFVWGYSGAEVSLLLGCKGLVFILGCLRCN